MGLLVEYLEVAEQDLKAQVLHRHLAKLIRLLDGIPANHRLIVKDQNEKYIKH